MTSEVQSIFISCSAEPPPPPLALICSLAMALTPTRALALFLSTLRPDSTARCSSAWSRSADANTAMIPITRDNLRMKNSEVSVVVVV